MATKFDAMAPHPVFPDTNIASLKAYIKLNKINLFFMKANVNALHPKRLLTPSPTAIRGY